MRGRTLEEKRYGPGIRPGPLRRLVAPWPGCGVEGCGSSVAGSIEIFVDAHDPGVDWYLNLLRRLPLGSWVRVRFCLAHLQAVSERSIQEQEEPDLWEPGRDNPPVMINPPRLERA